MKISRFILFYDFRFYLFLFFFLLQGACFNRGIVKPPPDFSTDQTQLSSYISELKTTSNLMEEEFQTLGLNMNAISELHRLHYPENFPLTKFKHVLMRCLNTTHQDERNPEYEKVAKILGMTCEVLPLQALFESLERAENLSVAKRGLNALEGVRQQRFKIQNMLQKISPQILRIRKSLNAKKGALRRQRASLRRKANEYSTTEWAIAQDAINAYHTQLNDAWNQSETLFEKRKHWHKKLGLEIERLYKEIAILGE